VLGWGSFFSVIASSVYYGSLSHPFLLADNRYFIEDYSLYLSLFPRAIPLITQIVVADIIHSTYGIEYYPNQSIGNPSPISKKNTTELTFSIDI
jgi:hypothetical protein